MMSLFSRDIGEFHAHRLSLIDVDSIFQPCVLFISQTPAKHSLSPQRDRYSPLIIGLFTPEPIMLTISSQHIVLPPRRHPLLPHALHSPDDPTDLLSPRSRRRLPLPSLRHHKLPPLRRLPRLLRPQRPPCTASATGLTASTSSWVCGGQVYPTRTSHFPVRRTEHPSTSLTSSCCPPQRVSTLSSPFVLRSAYHLMGRFAFVSIVFSVLVSLLRCCMVG